MDSDGPHFQNVWNLIGWKNSLVVPVNAILFLGSEYHLLTHTAYCVNRVCARNGNSVSDAFASVPSMIAHTQRHRRRDACVWVRPFIVLHTSAQLFGLRKCHHSYGVRAYKHFCYLQTTIAHSARLHIECRPLCAVVVRLFAENGPILNKSWRA